MRARSNPEGLQGLGPLVRPVVIGHPANEELSAVDLMPPNLVRSSEGFESL